MRLTPRKDEISAVVELLEADGYDSADALAKDVIKRVADLLWERDWWTAIYRFGKGTPIALGWGPFSSETEAEKFLQKLCLPAPEVMSLAFKITSPMQQEHLNEKVIADTSPNLCKTCDHPKFTHEHAQYAGKCAAGGCGCRKHK